MGVSPREWLHAALEALSRHGIDGVRVEGLARDLGISKSGFYWHFRNRDDLLERILDYWSEEYTEVLSGDPDLMRLDATERLRRVMQAILERDLTRYDLALRAWADSNPRVASRVRAVYRLRLDFVRRAFLELGFENEELEMRTRLFVAYHSWERATYPTLSKRRLRGLIESRLALLTRR